MIALTDLKYIYERLMGGDADNPHYGDVNVEINSDLSTKHYKMQAVLYPERQPYKLEGINSEAFTLSFNFFANINSDKNKTEALEIINQIIGYKTGNYIKGDKTYTFYSYLDLGRPMSDPMIKSGNFIQVLSATGTFLIRDAQTGAVVGNDVTTSLTFADSTSGQLTVLEGTCQTESAGTAVTQVNSETGKTANSYGANTYSYKLLLMRDEVSIKLAKAAAGHTRLGINETVTITETYPDFTVTKDCVIVSLVLRHYAGAFAEVDLILREKAEFLNTDETEV